MIKTIMKKINEKKQLTKKINSINNIEYINFSNNGGVDIFGFTEESKNEIVNFVNNLKNYKIEVCEFFQTTTNFFIMIEKK